MRASAHREWVGLRTRNMLQSSSACSSASPARRSRKEAAVFHTSRGAPRAASSMYGMWLTKRSSRPSSFGMMSDGGGACGRMKRHTSALSPVVVGAKTVTSRSCSGFGSDFSIVLTHREACSCMLASLVLKRSRTSDLSGGRSGLTVMKSLRAELGTSRLEVDPASLA